MFKKICSCCSSKSEGKAVPLNASAAPAASDVENQQDSPELAAVVEFFNKTNMQSQAIATSQESAIKNMQCLLLHLVDSEKRPIIRKLLDKKLGFCATCGNPLQWLGCRPKGGSKLQIQSFESIANSLVQFSEGHCSANDHYRSAGVGNEQKQKAAVEPADDAAKDMFKHNTQSGLLMPVPKSQRFWKKATFCDTKPRKAITAMSIFATIGSTIGLGYGLGTSLPNLHDCLSAEREYDASRLWGDIENFKQFYRDDNSTVPGGDVTLGVLKHFIAIGYTRETMPANFLAVWNLFDTAQKNITELAGNLGTAIQSACQITGPIFEAPPLTPPFNGTVVEHYPSGFGAYQRSQTHSIISAAVIFGIILLIAGIFCLFKNCRKPKTLEQQVLGALSEIDYRIQYLKNYELDDDKG